MKMQRVYTERVERGFTMIEIIVVIGVLMLISSGATILFLSTLANNQREVIVNEIISSLRESQSRAMNGENQSEFGIYFEEHKYVTFSGSTYVEGNPDNTVNLLPAGVTIRNINFNSTDFVYYERMTGETNYEGSIDIAVIGTSGAKRISVNKLGIVNLEIIE